MNALSPAKTWLRRREGKASITADKQTELAPGEGRSGARLQGGSSRQGGLPWCRQALRRAEGRLGIPGHEPSPRGERREYSVRVNSVCANDGPQWGRPG